MTGVLVSAATGAMGSLLGKLATMLTEKYKQLKGVHGDIEFLKKELEAMHDFLLRMADVEEPEKQAKLRVDAIRNLSYDIEDSIDDFMLLVDRESDPDAHGLEELFRRCKKKIKDVNIHHKIAKEVKDIMNQVNEVSERYKRYQFGESSSQPKNAKVDPRVVAVFKDASELVGIDGPRDDLVKLLSKNTGESTNQQKVVSIVGYGGLGKTTLANQVYHNTGSSFDCHAFVSISRDPDMMKILSSILSQISKGDVRAEVGDQQLIIGQIREFLRHKRYFIVIDDIWDIPTWRILDCALLKNSRGSRVMTTTRKIDVALECCSFDEGLVYQIKPLNDADSKKLFFKRIFGCEERCPGDLKEVSEIIIKKCGGLPLAIDAISSLLAGRQTKEEWIRLGRGIGSAQGKNADIEAMNYILSLSYIDLPHYLRSCLLYLTLFPEDYEIERERLVHRWISEGFIHGEDGQDLVELGDAYFHELVNRSLIQPVDIGYDGKARHCRVHDTILDFLISKSADENFCALLRGHSKITQDVIDGRVRRLSLVGGSEDGGGVNISTKWNAPRVRSLGIFWDVTELPSFSNMTALRVLDVAAYQGLSDRHVKDIARLHQLRYLNFRTAQDVSKLPSEIGDLQYLETLALPHTANTVEIPTAITRLQRLVRLYTPLFTRFPDGFGKMKKLQVLEDIHIVKQSLKFLQGLGELASMKKLRIYCNVVSMEQDNKLVSCMEKLATSLRKLEACSLRDLYVCLNLGENDGVLEDVSFPALSSMREIEVYGQKICRFTKWLVSLANLEKLCVIVEHIEQLDLEMVGTLPTLLEFTLKLRGNREVEPITVTSGGFPELRSFLFNRLPKYDNDKFGWVRPKMKGLVFEAGAMPKLQALRLDFYDLKSAAGRYELGIRHLPSLASLCASLDCGGVRAADVEAAEGAFKRMADTHPNHPVTLEISYGNLDEMLPADDE